MHSATAARADAYRATDYLASGVLIAVNACSPEVDRLLTRHRARTAVFVTACNPHGRASGAVVNARRMARFVAMLRASPWRFQGGIGVGREGGWPPEPSLLVFAIGLRLGARLARVWRQNAVVAVARGQPARLLGLR